MGNESSSHKTKKNSKTCLELPDTSPTSNGNHHKQAKMSPKFVRSVIRRSFDRRVPPITTNGRINNRHSADSLPSIVNSSQTTTAATMYQPNDTRKDNEEIPTIVEPKTSRSMDTLSQKRSRFKELRYQSVRGTSSEPKSQRRPALKVPNNSDSKNKSTCSLTTKQIISEEEFEKLKHTKKGRRIADIIATQGELFDLYKIGESKQLCLTLTPDFDVTTNENELMCHSLDVNFLKLPDNKIEQTRDVYEVHVTFSEAKFRVDPLHRQNTTADKLLKAHAFLGRSSSIELTNEHLVIGGNFYNPEFGKMEFFRFELTLYPVHLREQIFRKEKKRSVTTENNNVIGSSDESICSRCNKTIKVNSLQPKIESPRQAFLRRYRDTKWGTFEMTLKGSYSQQDLLWTCTERPNVDEAKKTPERLRKKMF